jgi:serine/threonine protein kinase
MPIGEVGRNIIEENNDMLLITPLKEDLEYIANYILTPDHKARLLGKGTFGETFLFSRHAVKKIKLDNYSAYKDFVKEVGVWEELSRIPDLVPFIPKYLGSRVFPSDSSRPGMAIGIIIQTYEDVLSLQDYIRTWDTRPLSGDVAYKLIMNIKRGFDVMHANGYIHRDIKPANMLIRADMIEMPIIIDFGIVCKKPCMERYLAGTPLYTPLNALNPYVSKIIGQRKFPVLKKKGFFDKLFRRKNVIKKMITEQTRMKKLLPIYNDAWDNYAVSLVIAEIYEVTNWDGLQEKKEEVETMIYRLSSQIIPFLAASSRRENLSAKGLAELKEGHNKVGFNILNVIPEENNVLKAEFGSAAAPAAGGSRIHLTRKHKSRGRGRGRSLKGGR